MNIPSAVSLSHDGDVWRAVIGEHASNSLDPFEAITLTVGKAREAGYRFGSPADEPAPTPPAPTDAEPTDEAAPR